MDNFAQHLQFLLRSRSLTQRQLANAAEVSEPTVIKWLRGSIPSGDKLNRIAEFFGLHPDYLLNPAKYAAPLKKAKAAADAHDGDEKSKQAVYNRVAREETMKLIAAQDAQDQMPDGVDWKTRALIAEGKLLKASTLIEKLSVLVTNES